MEDNKQVVAKPAKEVKAPKAKKAVVKEVKKIVFMNYGQGLFVTGAYGIFMYGFNAAGLFNNSQVVLDILANNPLQISIAMVLIGLFSINTIKK
jgi:cell division septal protein FtsQ